MAQISRHLTIHGRVQGVGYRDWVQREATARQLRGWVRNRRDGTVEAVFSGSEAAVEDMIQACWEGPAMARTTEIEQAPCAAPEETGFAMLQTL